MKNFSLLVAMVVTSFSLHLFAQDREPASLSCVPRDADIATRLAKGFIFDWNKSFDEMKENALLQLKGKKLVASAAVVADYCLKGLSMASEVYFKFDNFGKFAGLFFPVNGTVDNAKKILTDAFRAVKGFRTYVNTDTDAYTIETDTLKVSVSQYNGVPRVQVAHKYENPHPEKSGFDPVYGVAGIPWGTDFEDMKDKYGLRKGLDISDVLCNECTVYQQTHFSPQFTLNLSDLNAILTPPSDAFIFRDNKLGAVGFDFDVSKYARIIDILNKSLGTNYDNEDHAYTWRLQDVTIDIQDVSPDAGMGSISFQNKTILGLH